MGGPCAVHDNDAAIPLGEPQAEFAQEGCEGLAVLRCPPRCEGMNAQMANRDAGALGLGSFPRCGFSDGAATVEKAVSHHGVCDVAPAVFQQGRMDRPIVLARNERQAARMFGDAGDLLPAGIVMGQVHDLPILADETPNDVEMVATGLAVTDGTSRNILEAEFRLVGRHEKIHDGGSVRSNRWIDVDMMNRATCPSMG